jgi:hypothetical protein
MPEFIAGIQVRQLLASIEPGSMITNPRAAQRKFGVRVRVGVVFSLGFMVSVRVVRFE